MWHEDDWDRLIQTLDHGSFGVRGFLKTLESMSYQGPIGHQRYNVKEDQERQPQTVHGSVAVLLTMLSLELDHRPPPPVRLDWRIDAIGSGFIMRDVHLVAHKKLGLHVVGITGRIVEQAREVASAHAIERVHDSYEQLIADPSIQALGVAVPPRVKPQVISEAVRHAGRIRSVLAQKPAAMSYRDAVTVVEACE